MAVLCFAAVVNVQLIVIKTAVSIIAIAAAEFFDFFVIRIILSFSRFPPAVIAVEIFPNSSRFSEFAIDRRTRPYSMRLS